MSQKKKVLLMGHKPGVTSMRSIIFANYVARDTRKLGATIDVEHSHVRFIGNLVLNLWDLAELDQEAYYFGSQRDILFRNVEALIYVFDVESREVERDMHYYQSCLEAIIQNSPNTKIYCLVHNMDLIPEDQRSVIYDKRESVLKKRSLPFESTCFPTSIWDETLYKAWSVIVRSLIPNIQELDSCASQLAEVLEADEVVIFERATLLMIANSVRRPRSDVHRHEKISNIIKQFKLSCSKVLSSFGSMEVRNSEFAAIFHEFTKDTMVLTVSSNSAISTAFVRSCARHVSNKFEQKDNPSSPRSPVTVRTKIQSSQTGAPPADTSLKPTAAGVGPLQKSDTKANSLNAVSRQEKHLNQAAETTLSQETDHICKSSSSHLLSSLSKDLEEAEKRVRGAKMLLKDVIGESDKQQLELRRELHKEQVVLKKQLGDQQAELAFMRHQQEQQGKLDKQRQAELLQLIQLQAQSAESEKELREELKQANEREQEAQQNIQQIMEEFAQTQSDLERRVELAEQKAHDLEIQWVVKPNEIEMTKRELGGGGWGIVKVAKFRGTEVAAKTLYQQIQSDYYRELFIREMNMAARLRHPNLTQFIGATIEGDMVILTELLQTSLRNVLEQGTIARNQTVSISLDVSKALNYLHLMQPEAIVHRDVSSANVLLDPLPNNIWKAKLADYGTVNTLCRLKTEGPGNPTYSAPEANLPTQQSPKMDVFSFGILLIEMCSGKFPEVDNRERLILKIKDRPFLRLLRRCIVYSKDKRPSMAEIIDELIRF